MLRLASDFDVNGIILRGLHRRLPAIDLVRAQDFLPEATPDPVVLAWTAAQDRVFIALASYLFIVVVVLLTLSENPRTPAWLIIVCQAMLVVCGGSLIAMIVGAIGWLMSFLRRRTS